MAKEVLLSVLKVVFSASLLIHCIVMPLQPGGQFGSVTSSSVSLAGSLCLERFERHLWKMEFGASRVRTGLLGPARWTVETSNSERLASFASIIHGDIHPTSLMAWHRLR